MTARRILHLLVLAGLVLAPFGRIGLAHAQGRPMPNPAPVAMPAPCHGDPAPAPDRDKSERTDCVIACAAMAPPAGLALAPPPASRLPGVAVLAFSLAGIRPEAEPPPPRLS